MSIYNNTITPTYLYVKQHSITGLKYFGKTTQKDPYKYLGSGTYWKKHINLHGKEFVKTIWLSELFTDKNLLTEFALKFSQENDIVNSKEWANLILENGIEGGYTGNRPCSKETRLKISAANKNPTLETRAKMSAAKQNMSAETRLKMSISQKGKTLSDEHKGKLKISHQNMSAETRLKMSISQKGKTLSLETRSKMSASGRNISDETRAKRSASLKGKVQLKVLCPYCNKEGGISSMNRWHFDNCKFK